MAKPKKTTKLKRASVKGQDVSGKLRWLLKSFAIPEGQFARQMSGKYSIRADAVHGWTTGERNPYGPNLERLTDFWQGRISVLSLDWWLATDEKFEQLAREALELQRTLQIKIPLHDYPRLSPHNLRNLAGSYSAFRKSLHWEGMYHQDVVSIFNHNDEHQLSVEWKTAVEPDRMSVSEFRGVLFPTRYSFHFVLVEKYHQEVAHGIFERGSWGMKEPMYTGLLMGVTFSHRQFAQVIVLQREQDRGSDRPGDAGKVLREIPKSIGRILEGDGSVRSGGVLSHRD